MAAIARRSLMSGAAAAMLVGFPPLRAAPQTMLIHKDPNCGCCSRWAAGVRAAGFETTIHQSGNLSPIKARLGIPQSLASCHTAEIEGYVIEGHVPTSLIRRLLAERPRAIGLAVPGMPAGSPGMEAPGTPEDSYDAILFGPSGQEVYARFRGANELP